MAVWFWGSDLENSLAQRHQVHFPNRLLYLPSVFTPLSYFSWFKSRKKEGINFRASLTHQQPRMKWLRTQSSKDITEKFFMAVVRSCQHLPIISFMFKCLNILPHRSLHLHWALVSFLTQLQNLFLKKICFFSVRSPTNSSAPGRDGKAFWSKQGSWGCPLKFHNWALTSPTCLPGFQQMLCSKGQ